MSSPLNIFKHGDKSHHDAPSYFPTTIHWVEADGVKFFYRAAGDESKPVILLLHGFPTSSIQYRHLFDKLSDKYRLIAPDFPGFGFTIVPEERAYEYTFDNLAKSVEAFVDAVNLKSFSMYIFDYGAPVGMRLTLSRPDAVKCIISQNGNVDVAGLGSFWDGLKDVWADPTDENKAKIKYLLSYNAIKSQYITGEKHPETIPPESFTLDAYLVTRPGQEDIQLNLFADYKTNVELYPKWQKWLADKQLPVLAAWGRNDEIFVPAGAESFKRIVKHAEVHLIEDAGHFVLENHSDKVVHLIRDFLAKNKI